MDQLGEDRDRRSLGPIVFLTLVGVLLNVLPAKAALALDLPLYLDSLGTVLVTMVGGFLPGVFAGFIANFVDGIADPTTLYYGVINILIATATVFLHRRRCFKSAIGIAAAIVTYALIGGGLGSVLTWCLYGFSFGEEISAPFVHAFYESGLFSPFLAEVAGGTIVDLVDKGIIVFAAAGIYAILPRSVHDAFAHLNLLERAGLASVRDKSLRRSLLVRVVAFLIVIELIETSLVSALCAYLYRQRAIESYASLAESGAEYAARAVDANQVAEFLSMGEDAPDYASTKEELENVMRSIDGLTYLYVYRCEPDGIHVVFDLDELDEDGNVVLEGEKPGSVIAYDASFAPYREALLIGEEIDPIITDDTYGWLLTVYVPIRDASGITQAYACADIAVVDLMADLAAFIAKIVSLLIAVSILLLYAAIYYAEQHLVIPINTMEREASGFAFGQEGEQEESLQALESLDIHTGDEISRLYDALTKLASDSTQYIDEIRTNAENLSALQEAIIIDFASMVEARDQCTGDHIQKTAFYVDVIAHEMINEGIYPDELDEEAASAMVRAAPLHDVGKIKISDTLLNKPGRLTEEEFALMKTHTTEGMKILSGTLTSTADVGYLKESIDMAWCHHEWWDGSGYPRGLSRQEIPLAARVMAVADVFDALVSRRSYKKPFSFDKAVDIIREESGTHFDPKVAGAFLAVVEELRPMIEENQRQDALEHPEDYA